MPQEPSSSHAAATTEDHAVSRRTLLKFGVGGILGGSLLAVAGCSPSRSSSSSASTPASMAAGGGASAAGAASSASAASTKKVTLTVWDRFTDPQGGGAITKIYELFEAAHPNIKVDRQALPDANIRQKARLALASGTGPDIVYYPAGPGYSGALAQAGLLHPLDDYADKYGWKTKMADQYRLTSTFNGKLYGLPLETTLDGQLVNKTLMAKAGFQIPQTTADLVTFCEQAGKAGYTPLAYSQNPGVFAKNEINMGVLNAMGPDALTSFLTGGAGSFESKPFVDTIQFFLVDLVKANAFPKGLNGETFDQANALFNSGKSLILPGGSWALRHLTQATGQWDIEIMPYYSVPGGAGRYYPIAADPAWSMSQATNEPDAAAELLDFFYSPEAVKLWVEQASFAPPVAYDPSTMNIPAVQKAVAQALQDAAQGSAAANAPQIGPSISEFISADMFSQMASLCQAVVSGSKTPEQMASQLQTGWATLQQQEKSQNWKVG